MDLLFNHTNQGQVEIKKTLGFLDGDFTYANLEPDIKLNTPYLVDLVSQEVYDKVVAYYKDNSSVTGDEEKARHQSALEYMQLYILSMAYLDFAPNNDLTHSNAGRVVSKDQNDTIPWDWQIQKDNSALAKRAYKALDLLFILLDKSNWTEWTSSEAYKTANKLFVKNTNQFDAVFPINKSGQLYYRLVPFMDDFEKRSITAILSDVKVTELKEATTPDTNQKALLTLVNNAIVYLTMEKAYKVLPVEMFAEGLLYNENTRMKSQARAEVMQFLSSEAKKYLVELENTYSQQNLTFEEQNPTPGLEDGKNYVNL